MIYFDFESILVPKDGKQNPVKTYNNKCKKHAYCSFDCFDNDIIFVICHSTGKCSSAHRYCNTTVKLNHKIAVVFYNLKIAISISLYKN